MSSHVHIGLYDALREAGASEEKARIAAADFPLPQYLASKEDLLKAFGEVKTEIADLRGEVKTEIANFRAALYRAAFLMAATIVTVIVGILKLFP